MESGKSKTCKAVSHDECGVWLDAAELRAKKQRKLPRPIYKLLNPLARSGGYSMAVALNLTQTKMEMPVTKQSRISSFFAPQRKKGKDAEDCSSSWPSGMSSTPLPVAHSGTKRKREMFFKLPSELADVSGRSSPTKLQEHDADIARVSQVRNNDDDKEQQFFHLILGYQSEEHEPAGKKPCKNIKTRTVTDKQTDPSKAIKCDDGPEEIPESLLHTDETQQYSHENFYIHRNMCGENSDGYSASLSTEDMYTQDLVKDQSRSCLAQKTAAEIQNMAHHLVKSYKEPELCKQWRQWSPVKKRDKENRGLASPRLNLTLSPLKQRVCSSPGSTFNRKLCRTPKKSIGEAQENGKASLGMLFTQDSEGFRVIAHRSKKSICPLKDQTNSCKNREYLSSSFVMPLDTKESSVPEPEILFTQDSEGNLVIKH